MKQILVMLAAAACFILAVAAHAATLRPEVLVTGEQVTLGDLFDGLPADRAMVAVARAPGPGRTVTLDAGWITRVAQTYGVAWTPGRGERRVVIRRASAEELAALAAAMHDQLSAFLARSSTPAAPAAEAADPQPAPPLAPPSVLAAPEPAPAATPAATSAAEPAAEPRERQVPVLSRRLRNGEVITARDITWITIPNDRRAQDVITDADALIGLTPHRPLAAQQPLRPGDVQAPTLVNRGETVAMLLQAGRLTIAARGRALDSGARGDVIRVTNVDSRRTVDAVVVGPGTVTVRLGANLASLN